MTEITLGKTIPGEELTYKYVPFESRGILIQGITGSRKSSLYKEISKRFSSMVDNKPPQQILFDIEGEMGVLRKTHQDFVVIGKNGEVPLILDKARQTGTIVRQKGIDVIIQVSDFDEEIEIETYIEEFLKGVTNVEPEFYQPCLIMLDEGQSLATNIKNTVCRGQIVKICQRGRKQGILTIIATQGIKDFYKNARIQLVNRIIGYTHDPSERNAACDLLGWDKTENEKIKELGDKEKPAGRFYTQGNDIVSETTMFQLESEKISREEMFSVPPGSHKAIENANIIRNHISMDLENLTEFEKEKISHSETKTRLDAIKTGNAAPEDIRQIKTLEYVNGWNAATKFYRNAIEHTNSLSVKRAGYLKKPKLIEFWIQNENLGNDVEKQTLRITNKK